MIDAGYTGYQALLGEDLPESVMTGYFCDDITGDGVPDGSIDGCDSFGDSVHGAGVAEIVHDMAPEAQLYLMTIDLVAESGQHWEDALNTASKYMDIDTVSQGVAQWQAAH